MALGKYRKGIDEIDSKIIEYLNARSELAVKIGAWKKDCDHPVYVPERESSLFRRLKERNNGPLADLALANIYREIISGAIAVERPVRVARISTFDDFNHPARLTFGDSANHIAFDSVAEAVEAVVNESADYAVIDIVGIDGEVCGPLLHLLAENRTSIVAERVASSSKRTAWVLGAQRPEPSGNDRTALLLEFSSLGEVSAKIAETLKQLKLLEITGGSAPKNAKTDECDTSSIGTLGEPFPIAIENSIFLTVSGHRDDESFSGKLDALGQYSDSTRILASFPVL